MGKGLGMARLWFLCSCHLQRAMMTNDGDDDDEQCMMYDEE